MKGLYRYLLIAGLAVFCCGHLFAEDFNPDNPPEPMVQYPVSVAAIPADGTSSISSGGMFSLGRTLTISVTPSSDYTFDSWTLNGHFFSNSQSISYTVGDSAASFVAVMRLKPLLSVSVSPEGAGSAYGGGRYAEGSRLRIYTYGNSGYTFLHWTLNGEFYTANSSFYYYQGAEDAQFVAVYRDDNQPEEPDPDAPFTPDNPAEPEVYYRLDVTTDLPQGVSPVTITKSAFYAPGKYVSLSVTSPEGYTFLHWTLNGILYSDQTQCPYTTGDSSVVFTARFAVNSRVLLEVTPDGAGTLSGAGSYSPGTKILVSTSPRDGYTFVRWDAAGREYALTQSFYYIVGDADVAFTAVYEAVQAPPPAEPEEDGPFIPSNPPEPEAEKTALLISVAANDAVMGSVSGLPTTPLFAGDLITLTAVPANEGYYFLHWADGNTANPRDITLTADARYTAVFAPRLFTVVFYDEDGTTVLSEAQWGYGQIPECISPAKPGDEYYDYRFTGWFPTPVPVTQDAAYYATYKAIGHISTGVETTEANSQEPTAKSQKLLIDGQLFIRYKGTMYNVQGKRVN